MKDQLALRLGDRSPKKGEELIWLADLCKEFVAQVGGAAKAAKQLGVAPGTLDKFLRIARAPQEIKQLIARVGLGLNAAYNLLRLDPESRKELLDLIARLDLVEGEILRIVSSVFRGGDLHQCAAEVARRKGKALILFRIPEKLSPLIESLPEEGSKLRSILDERIGAKIHWLGTMKLAGRKYMAAFLDPGTYRRARELARLHGVEIFDLVAWILERELQI